MDGDVTLLDGKVIRCRQDSSTMWIIFSPNPTGCIGNIVGMEKPTHEENSRWSAANTATYGAAYGYRHRNVVYEPRTPGMPHPEGWFTANQCYRNEIDEAAAIARWRERT